MASPDMLLCVWPKSVPDDISEGMFVCFSMCMSVFAFVYASDG